MIPQIMAQVAGAAEAFESRWTLNALRRNDPDLHQIFGEQQDLYHEALIRGSDHEVEEQAAAMCRGWAAVARAMDAAEAEDDAYLLGCHGGTGTRVAIGEQKHAIARVRELHGDKIIWITPDEVAALVGGMELLKAAKGVFPDAEVINLYPNEPAIEDG
ncbi:MAG: hypothetical protein HN577_03885 [Rhodospirillaceae bacterium]|nr:hypothetical protein [Rhodospirillaceae bacterium]